MNRVKTSLRNRMGQEALDFHMRIVANRVPIEDFDFPTAVTTWLRVNRRYRK
jgi:hypothetical protein